MVDSTTNADKRVVEELNYGSKTAMRAVWTAWEFSIEGSSLVQVTNASYGCEKDEHSFLIGIEDRDGLPVPVECSCPADEYNEEYACKHRVACAAIAGPVVLQAALTHATPTVDTDEGASPSFEPGVRPDGGAILEDEREDGAGVIEAERECVNGDRGCEGSDGSVTCFECYELPACEEGE